MRRNNQQLIRAGLVLALGGALAFSASPSLQRKAEAQASSPQVISLAAPQKVLQAAPEAELLAIAIEVDQQDRCLLNLPATALVIRQDARKDSAGAHEFVRKPVACG